MALDPKTQAEQSTACSNTRVLCGSPLQGWERSTLRSKLEVTSTCEKEILSDEALAQAAAEYERDQGCDLSKQDSDHSDSSGLGDLRCIHDRGKAKDIRKRARQNQLDARHDAWLREQRYFIRSQRSDLFNNLPVKTLSEDLSQANVPSARASAILGGVASRRNATARKRIPLSPSVNSSSGSDSSEDWGEKDYRQALNRERIGIQQWARYRYDYPAQNTLPVPRQPFPFMKLPSEIAQEVLKLLLTRNMEIQQVSADRSTNSYDLLPVYTRLFAVSRAMKAVAEYVFFSYNEFKINVSSPLPQFLTQSINGNNCHVTQHIPQLRLYFDPRPTGMEESIGTKLDTLAKALVACKRLRGTNVIKGKKILKPQTLFVDNLLHLTLFGKYHYLMSYFCQPDGVKKLIWEDGKLVKYRRDEIIPGAF